MIRSDSIKELVAALAKAQGEMNNPKFDSTNPHFRSKYASLASVRNAVIPVLSKHGIAMVQELTTTTLGVSCAVVLMHASGESISFDPLYVPAMKQDAQGLVAAATYAKRTTMQSAVCVVGEEDDDGNAATGRTAGTVAEEAPTVKLDDAVVKTLRDAWTVDELKTAWNAIPVGSRHGYTKEKDAAKLRITAAGAA